MAIRRPLVGCVKIYVCNWRGWRCRKVFTFELGGEDLILGIAWLATFGEVRINWKDLTMCFIQAGNEVSIKEGPSLTKRVITPAALLKERDIAVVTLVWEMGCTELKAEG